MAAAVGFQMATSGTLNLAFATWHKSATFPFNNSYFAKVMHTDSRSFLSPLYLKEEAAALVFPDSDSDFWRSLPNG